MDNFTEKVKGQYLYYILVGVVSLLLLCFLPFLGTEVGLAFVLPTTVGGWIVFAIEKLSMAVCNMLIFACFVQQARVNIADNKDYKEALDRYNKGIRQDKRYVPKSPKEYFRGTYIKKGSTVFLTTIVGTIALTQAILTFDIVVFITTVFALVMALVFGIYSMKRVELYWTQEFINFVEMNFEKEVIVYEEKKGENTYDTNQGQGITEPGRASTQE